MGSVKEEKYVYMQRNLVVAMVANNIEWLWEFNIHHGFCFTFQQISPYQLSVSYCYANH
jgi:hypothetical protein